MTFWSFSYAEKLNKQSVRCKKQADAIIMYDIVLQNLKRKEDTFGSLSRENQTKIICCAV